VTFGDRTVARDVVIVFFVAGVVAHARRAWGDWAGPACANVTRHECAGRAPAL